MKVEKNWPFVSPRIISEPLSGWRTNSSEMRAMA